MRIALRSKIHRAYVTDANPDYIGSIIIDRELMEKVDLWEYEKVLICDVTNGERWETYVLPGERGAGTVSVQGAGAKLCEKGDCLIILSFEVTNVPIEPKMILVNERNQFVEYLEGVKYEEEVLGARH
jgi:aspartate 1-decarboxylase